MLQRAPSLPLTLPEVLEETKFQETFYRMQIKKMYIYKIMIINCERGLNFKN